MSRSSTSVEFCWSVGSLCFISVESVAPPSSPRCVFLKRAIANQESRLPWRRARSSLGGEGRGAEHASLTWCPVLLKTHVEGEFSFEQKSRNTSEAA